MTVREAKKLWHHRQATILNHIRTVRDSREESSRDRGTIQRIIRNYYLEWDRYNQLIHANDRFRLTREGVRTFAPASGRKAERGCVRKTKFSLAFSM